MNKKFYIAYNHLTSFVLIIRYCKNQITERGDEHDLHFF